MSNTGSAASTSTNSSSGEENPLWIAAAVLLCGGGVWGSRNSWYATLAPYGLTAQDTEARSVDPWSDTTQLVGTGHYHISVFGWGMILVGLAGVAAGLWCAAGWWAIGRWRADAGVGAVPTVPVISTGIAALGIGWWLVLGATGGLQRWPLFVVAMGAVGAAVAVAAGFADPAARQWRSVQAFAARADQILGHGHPGTGRVRAHQWNQRGPARLVIRTGPGWQHKPAEMGELNRYTREFGWPTYRWSYDPMRKQVVGIADVTAKKVEG